MPVARKGAEQAEQSAKTGGAGRVEFLRIKDGDPPVYVRMIDDCADWVNADTHPAIPTKNQPSGYTGKWPALMSATCQNDPMFLIYDEAGKPVEPATYEAGMGHCWIHENMAGVLDRYNKPKSNAAPMVFALCVLREPVTNDAGAIVAMRDVTEEWSDAKGSKHRVPAFRVISQRWGNFFSAMKAGAFLDNTVVNKDWRIARQVNDYIITPLPPTADHAPGTPSWKTYTDAMEVMKIDIFASVVEQASAEYYRRFFVPGDFTDGDGGAEVHAAASDPESGAEVDQAKLDAFKTRLQDAASAPSSS